MPVKRSVKVSAKSSSRARSARTKVSGKMTRDYRSSDLKVVYQHARPKNWGDAVKWVSKYGADNARLTPGEVMAMKHDLSKVQSSRRPFVSDVKKAYELVHSGRR